MFINAVACGPMYLSTIASNCDSNAFGLEPFFKTTYVFSLLLIQLFSSHDCNAPLIETKKSKLKCDCEGMFFITPVILRLSVSFIVSVLPTTLSVVLKYFFAIFSVITTQFGSFNAVFGLPAIIGNVNTSNNVESV